MAESTLLPITTRSELAQVIDHTMLKPDATADAITNLCQEARDNNIFGVCVAPSRVRTARECLAGTGIRVMTVIAFPHGNTLPRVKAFEAAQALQEGADELDMVLNIGRLKEGQYDAVKNDIKGVVDAARSTSGAIVKVIIETALLSDALKAVACRLARDASADFVKTSTGFSYTGATIHDVTLMKQTVGASLGIKAAGGIRDLPTALAMLQAGATRLGCSASVSLLAEMTDSD